MAWVRSGRDESRTYARQGREGRPIGGCGEVRATRQRRSGVINVAPTTAGSAVEGDREGTMGEVPASGNRAAAPFLHDESRTYTRQGREGGADG
jgi:hypothetical protein